MILSYKSFFFSQGVLVQAIMIMVAVYYRNSKINQGLCIILYIEYFIENVVAAYKSFLT